jgi:hypothetical protein
MFKSFLQRSLPRTANDDASAITASALQATDDGILFPSFCSDDLTTLQGKHRSLVAYLLQLEQEGYLRQTQDQYVLPWEQLFILIKDSEHSGPLTLLDLPPLYEVTPLLSSEGGLSDSGFKVSISSWRKLDGSAINGSLSREGAFFSMDGNQYMLPSETWHLLKEVKDFARRQTDARNEATNQLGWASIHKRAIAAGAIFDGFLNRTIVIKPDALRLKLNKSDLQGMQVLEVMPMFEGQPDGWLDTFDRTKSVPDHYTIPSDDGGITHVLIAPEVKTVLQEIRSLPGRRVSGDKALQLLRNPYSCLGEDANKVLNQEQFEQDREQAGFSFLRFSLHTTFDSNERISSVRLQLDSLSDQDADAVNFTYTQANQLAPFVHELQLKLASGLPCGFWQGYELELSDFTQSELDGVEVLLNRWKREERNEVFDGIFDLSQYGNRVIGIGLAKTITSPYLTRESGQTWLPEGLLDSMGLDGALLAKWDTDNPELLEQFKLDIEKAHDEGQSTVEVPGLGATLSLKTAEEVAIYWQEKLKAPKPKGPPGNPRPDRSVLLIDDNVEELSYVKNRALALQIARATSPAIPDSLFPHIKLHDHQQQGIAWLQHLFQCSPLHASGCLLADDMGLGKTLQLLSFIAEYLAHAQNDDPILVVAPVSLLDNWKNEIKRFFTPGFATVLKLYGSELSDLKFKKAQLPTEITERGIYNLLKPNWRQGRQIVLTTYETLRDHEFSLARQHWAIVVCDEAQKIKNPAALVTQAAKAIPARFKIACTGTPVENSLTDLWCLFDFIQPGLLGSLNEFGKKYRQPADALDDTDRQALDELRALIEPQILRRLKSDVAKDLPAKMKSLDCMDLAMSTSQLKLYKSELSRFQTKKTLDEQTGSNKSAMILGLLHTMKMICAHPHSVYPEGELLDVSPKMLWLMKELEKIKPLDEKVIVFTELRDIQRALQLTILDRFNMHVTVINGDTNASSERGLSRQGLIDVFQAKPGFGVIILSTTAVGFGVNVQAANHVIHFTRCWNPAKEDQATDRAYRIGQTKDVFVYYPTITTQEFETFEQKLDKLLARKRLLANDMLNGSGDINLSELAST